MAIISASGREVIVDDEDFELVSRFRWYVMPTGYVVGHCRGAVRARARLHRLLLDPSPGQEVDHIDGDPLNNRRANLRIASRSQNAMNRRVPTFNTSGFRGVYRAPNRLPWRARIGVARQKFYIGDFATPEEAAAAYNEAALRLHGEFARLNVIPGEA